MIDEIKTQYKQYPILYNEGSCRFEAFVDGQKSFEDNSLRNLREKIDNFEKLQAKKDFKRFTVLVTKYVWSKPDKFIEAEVTSITEEGHYWITVEGNRRKEIAVLLVTPDNIEKTNRITLIRTEISLLQDEMKQIEQSLEYLRDGKRPRGETK